MYDSSAALCMAAFYEAAIKGFGFYVVYLKFHRSFCLLKVKKLSCLEVDFVIRERQRALFERKCSLGANHLLEHFPSLFSPCTLSSGESLLECLFGLV